MTIQRTLVIILLLSLAGLALGLWAYPRLPELAPSHWNIAGEVDGYMPRGMAVALIPAVMLLTGLLLLFLPLIDPLRENVKRFRTAYNWTIVGTMVFLLLLHALLILAGLGYDFNKNYPLIVFSAAGLVGLGFLLERTKPNWFAGIRTPWTLSSPTVWDKTHRLGGKLFKAGGAVVLVGLALPPAGGFILLMVVLMAISLATVVYSYVVYREEKEGQASGM